MAILAVTQCSLQLERSCREPFWTQYMYNWRVSASFAGKRHEHRPRAHIHLTGRATGSVIHGRQVAGTFVDRWSGTESWKFPLTTAGGALWGTWLCNYWVSSVPRSRNGCKYSFFSLFSPSRWCFLSTAVKEWWWWWWWWLLLCSAIIHSQGDSLCSHAILHEWLAFLFCF